jgi:hypothetical protein
MAPKLTLIRWTTLAGAAALGAALGWLGLTVLGVLGRRQPIPSWLVAGGLAFCGLAGLAGAWFAHQRFHVLHRYPAPEAGLALTALAKACALTGAALAGAYLLLAGLNLPRWAVQASRDRVLRGAASAAAAVFLMVGGKALERECQTHHPRPKGTPPADPEPGQNGH